MRIVAGTAKGRSFQAPAGALTRPTGDRVREAIFSMVISLRDIEGATVVDLFAGSGALGMEALSRGAGSATFVERDRPALEVIRANLSHLGMDGPESRLLSGDAVVRVATLPPADIVFADPPYAFERWEELTENLRGAGLAVLESGAELGLDPGWDVVRVKRYGGTVVTVARPPPGPKNSNSAQVRREGPPRMGVAR